MEEDEILEGLVEKRRERAMNFREKGEQISFLKPRERKSIRK
jgi:hypothetical protein